MNTRLHRGAMAAAALIGCIAMSAGAQGQRQPPGSSPSPCTGGICIIKVTVSDCNKPGGVSVDRPYVSAATAVNMRWQIVTPGFEFASDGIRFDPPNPQFERQQSPNANEFRIQNKKTQTGDFYYFVNVKGCLPLDPWIRND